MSDDDNATSDDVPAYPLWQRVLMFPLVVVFTCDWHRIHMCILFFCAPVVIAGYCLDNRYIAGWGAVIAVPSALCLMVLYPIGVILLVVGEHGRRS